MRHALDDRDLRILEILQQEGRIKKSDLAQRVNLSAAACWDRLKRLETAGLIRGYHADIAIERIARVSYFVVQIELENHKAGDFQRFERAVLAVPEITRCLSVGGGIDYVMEITAPDVERYQALMQDILEREIGVKRYFTFVVTKTVKAGPPPVGELFPADSERTGG